MIDDGDSHPINSPGAFWLRWATVHRQEPSCGCRFFKTDYVQVSVNTGNNFFCSAPNLLKFPQIKCVIGERNETHITMISEEMWRFDFLLLLLYCWKWGMKWQEPTRYRTILQSKIGEFTITNQGIICHIICHKHKGEQL